MRVVATFFQFPLSVVVTFERKAWPWPAY